MMVGARVTLREVIVEMRGRNRGYLFTLLAQEGEGCRSASKKDSKMKWKSINPGEGNISSEKGREGMEWDRAGCQKILNCWGQ